MTETAPAIPMRRGSQPVNLLAVEWEETRLRLEEFWSGRENPHISIIGATGSGKSYLIRHGILPLVRWDRVLFVDVKGDDKTLQGLGKAVPAIPSKTWRDLRPYLQREQPRDNWYRLTVSDDYTRGADQIDRAFHSVWQEGEWVVVVDELRALTDTRANAGYGHLGWWSKFMLRGRSRGVIVINSTQEPAWVRSAFYTQASFHLFGRIEDERAHKRVTEIAASRDLLNHLPHVPKRKFIYTDNHDAERIFHLTGL